MDDTTPELSSNILRGLTDRSYDKRKSTGQELTVLVKGLWENGEKDRLSLLLRAIHRDLISSRNVNSRKGGLLALASVTIGIGEAAGSLIITSDTPTGTVKEPILNLVVPPLLAAFEDADPRVAYYATEALYNVTKVVRRAILRFAPTALPVLFRLFVHTDIDVKNGGMLLNALLREIVSDATPADLDISLLMPAFQSGMRRSKSFVRLLLLGWLETLYRSPALDFLAFLPELLFDLFAILSDNNREVRETVHELLIAFLQTLREKKLVGEEVEMASLFPVLYGQTRSGDRSARLLALRWIGEFILLAGEQLHPQFSSILGCLFPLLRDTDTEISSLAVRIENKFITMVHAAQTKFEFNSLITLLLRELDSGHVQLRITALQWLLMLHQRDPMECRKFCLDLTEALLRTLVNKADDVFALSVEVLSLIASDVAVRKRVITRIMDVLCSDDEQHKQLLETRGTLVIRKLCVHLAPSDVYKLAAEYLGASSNLPIVTLMVQIFNLVLLSAPELASLRQTIRDSCNENADADQKELFKILFRSWSHNLVCVFCLCILGQRYDVSAALIDRFGDAEIDVDFLMQLDKLVQLLESPLFADLRMLLLSSDLNKRGALLKSLYGVLMLLPQTSAYKTLGDRLSTVSSKFCNHGMPIPGLKTPDLDEQKLSEKDVEALVEYVKYFDRVQEKHTSRRLDALFKSTLPF